MIYEYTLAFNEEDLFSKGDEQDRSLEILEEWVERVAIEELEQKLCSMGKNIKIGGSWCASGQYLLPIILGF